MNTSKRAVLITGAAGFIGSLLRRHWAGRYSLRLADVRQVEELTPDEEFAECDIGDLDAFRQVCAGIDTVVHLAADRSPRAEFYASLLARNVIGGYNGFEAARQAGCRRLVFASSINAVLGYEPTETPATWEMPVFPQNVYGATKCWGEALARAYADQHDLSCMCVRLSSPRFRQDEWDPEEKNHGISERDTAQVFQRCVEAPDDVSFAIVHGVSRHRDQWFQVSCSDPRIGFEPEDGTAFPRSTDVDVE